MRKYIALFFLVMISTQSFSQNYTLKIDSLYTKQTTNFNQLNHFVYNANFEKSLKLIPINRKIDLTNPNFGKVNYDISNPNKSTDLPNFFIYGISNFIANLFY
ncbi:hypothetical protein [Empedobacter brevis]|uniref:hypothetical protein n=1 Tax=Empedobacter brevis TaxID=247 RepID=UPI0039AFDB8B